MGVSFARAGFLLALELTLLYLASCLQHRPGWRFSSFEVVIPHQLSSRKALRGSSGTFAEVPGRLSYSLRFGGKRYVVHMRVKKFLLPRHLPVLVDNKHGAPQEEYPYVPNDCYYHGYLEGIPASMAVLNTCQGGLRGTLHLDDFTYEIEPLHSSTQFEHVLSQLVPEEGEAGQSLFRCTLTNEEMNERFSNSDIDIRPRAGPYSHWWPHVRYLKIAICVSSSRVETHNGNLTIHVDQMVTLTHIVDSIYKQFRVFTILVFLYLWQYSDKVPLIGSSSEIAEHYGLWKSLVISNNFPHDTSALVTGNKAGESGYAAFPNSICSGNWAVILLWLQDDRVFYYSVILAHYIGHNFGLPHDQIYCHCIRRSHCLMEDHPLFSDSLSNCSYGRFFNLVNYWDQCLNRLPNAYDNYAYSFHLCGNKKIDYTEQCDCGSIKECLADPCCDLRCERTPGSSCGYGPCCEDCHFSPMGLACRRAVSTCDLPEFCNGTIHLCPLDTYVQDGTPCTSNAICFKGNCTDRHLQCRQVFGHNGVINANDACYEQLNIKGDRFGNCGMEPERKNNSNGMEVKEEGTQIKYITVPCRQSAVLCGRLQCEGLKIVPKLDEHITVHQMSVRKNKREIFCFGIEHHFGTGWLDFGMVWDGSKCSKTTMCLNHMCVPIAQLHFDCTPAKCNYRGVCNNNRNCHCQFGWAPPFCTLLGYGGSLDSGPTDNDEVDYVLFAILIFVLVRMILFMVSFSTAVIMYIRENKKIAAARI
ncbi:disintegrin and metalloproteinase domain-containing protein 20-like [Sarcophilus harrisii]|uniref:disintegrin and metalloproteinase domain-containing protein 20-like n=1 Tax=Sarcophilus harrisii TaxID=9305 RepID=UPI0002738FD0|nr:disintegrin and metalloproteinase domain-containing protein 20-like [Sarcophilus harrisii]